MMPIFDFLHKKDHALDVTDQRSIMVVGLGNPGREYRETRHNIGFLVIDRMAEKSGIKLTRVQSKAIIGSGFFGGIKVILVKPQTYMNLSGQAVSALARYYQIQLQDLIVAHDDVDLPFGTIRMRPGGGSAGQKGVASIIKLIGTQDFPRLRMGVGRPPGRMDAAAYVLQSFPKSEEQFLQGFLDRATDALTCFIQDGLEAAMNRFNQSDQD
jgi:PTH1 family peptidyl-tRNA hydrolase